MNTIVGVNVFEAPPPLGAAVEPAPTSVAAVAGVFERGRPHQPVRLTGPEQIERFFGRPTAGSVSALALRLYFQNGGREVEVSRITASSATPAALVLDDRQAAPEPALRLGAGDRGDEDPGLWGRRLSAIVSADPAFTGALTADAAIGATSVTLADATGLSIGDTLLFVDASASPVVEEARSIDAVNAATGVVSFTGGLGDALTAAGAVVASPEFRLRILYRAEAGASPEIVEDWRGLTMERGGARYAPAVLGDALSGSRYVTAQDVRPAGSGAARDVLAPASEASFVGGSEAAPVAADYVGSASLRTGLRAFDRKAVQLLTTPDVHSLSVADRRIVVEDALAWCAARGDCAYIGSLPDRGGASARPQGPEDYTQSEADYVAAIDAYTTPLRRPKSYGAFYGPHGATLDPTATGPARLRMIPLCLPVAGIFADIALRRGVFKAPAGAGAQVRGVVALSAHLTDRQNTDVVRDALANMVRRDDLLGLHVASSRTLSSDARWRFVNVRLLFNFIVASLRAGLRGFVHEIHDERLRRRAVTSVSAFLEELRRRGAFAAMDAERAYRVKSDADNNTAAAIARGELNIDVEINPARPAEQINLRVGVTPLGVSLTES